MKLTVSIARVALTLVILFGVAFAGEAQETPMESKATAIDRARPFRGVPTRRPVKRQTLTPAAFNDLLSSSAAGLLQLAGKPKCTVDIYSLSYHTIGGRNEPTIASTAVMIPSGPAAGCEGHLRPVVLVAHGTSIDKNYDLTSLTGDINGQNEGLSSAAIFAAQGYIVVLPNYAGYAGSTLGYAPFLNGEQQSADMIDALRASRRSFPDVAFDGIRGKLFVTGYSQGGYVALATERAMERYPVEFRVTAAATGSGPYALSLLIDKEVGGAPSALAPLLFNLIATSWQESYGNVYREPSDIYAPQYAQQAQGLLPGVVPQNTLFAQNTLPRSALFQTGSLPPPDVLDPDTAVVNKAGFAPDNFLLNTTFRNALVADAASNPCTTSSGQRIEFCGPTTGLRRDALRNDLLNFVPRIPLQMCGAHSDSLVYFFNTQVAAQYFRDHGMPRTKLSVVDLDPGTSAPSGPSAALQKGFVDARAQEVAALGSAPGASLRIAEDIHVLAAPFCVIAARNFFESMK